MPSPPPTKNFAMTRFQVKVDGHPIACHVKSVEGGLIKVESATELVGSYHIPKRHLATRTVEPITFDIGMSDADWVIGLLDKVINKRDFTRINGEVLHCDVNTALRFRQEFSRGLVTEIGFPSLDAASKDSAYVKVKIQPESVDWQAYTTPGPKIQPERGTKQKLWNANAFRLSLSLNGKDLMCERTTKIEAFTVKLNTKAHQRGGFFLPEYIPTKLQFPDKISVTLPMHYAGEMINWFRLATSPKDGGNNGSKAGGNKADAEGYEATGSITFLDPTRTKDLYTIDLFGVAPENWTMTKTDANSTTTKLCKFDLYVHRMEVSKKGQLGK